MKKKYIKPQMEVYRFQSANAIQVTSPYTPEDWTGGGGAGIKIETFDDSDFENLPNFEHFLF